MAVVGRVARLIRAHVKPPRGGVRDILGQFTRRFVDYRWRRRLPGRAHSLRGPLIVSLTSYPPRFPTLALTLKCLLSQSVKPDAVVLWLAEADVAKLPRDVLRLKAHGLTIETAPDLRSYKKILPALERYPAAYIVTADDDVYYWRSWLEDLIEGDVRDSEIRAHRAHRIRLDARGRPKPYMEWEFDTAAGPASILTFATGVGGVLYPPGSLHDDVLDVATYKRLCPDNDDLWLYWMARRAGSKVRKIGPFRRFVPWAGSQQVALAHGNLDAEAGNDVQIANLIAEYGWPIADAHKAPEREREARLAPAAD